MRATAVSTIDRCTKCEMQAPLHAGGRKLSESQVGSEETHADGIVAGGVMVG